MESSGLRLVEDERRNAVLAWAVLGFLLAAATAEVLWGSLLWAAFVLAVAALGAVPALVRRDYEAMLPWELLALAAAPVVGRTLVAGRTVGELTLTGRVTTYVAVAAVALVVAAELDRFTPVRMNGRFAVLFVVITTTAAAGVWAVAQWLSDAYLGTAFFAYPGAEESLMWDFVAATLAGVLSGVLFGYYFRRRGRGATRGADGREGGEPQ